MTTADTPALVDHIDIAAAPEAVWALVSDPRNLTRWSPQVESTRLKAEEPGPGVRFTNLNAEGELTWVTHAEIVAFTPPEELAFRVEENAVVWSFHLAPDGSGGTRLTQRRDAPEGISAASRELTDTFMGGPEAFTATMRAGMRQTLEAIRAEAESRG